MTARRVGLTPTPRRVSSASGWMAPATSQNAAAETSPGTRSWTACTDTPPSTVTATRPSAASSRSTGTPRALSMRSVWSRVATDSRTVVRPSARSPASRIADFTCALGTGVAMSIDRSGVWPTTVRGGRESFRRAWSTAPIERSGSMIRATGRPAQRRVAVEDARDRQPGEQPGEQPQARAGVAAVEDSDPARRARPPRATTTR